MSAADDLDNGGYTDVVIGVPFLQVDSVHTSGAIVLHGPVAGELTGRDAGATPPGVPEEDDAVDHAAKVVRGGDLDGDGLTDLLVGALFEDTDTQMARTRGLGTSWQARPWWAWRAHMTSERRRMCACSAAKATSSAKSSVAAATWPATASRTSQ